jgi:site-specific recombinase XerC
VILELLVGCALRRQELAALEIETIQLRQGRWVLADLEGKGRHVRTVAVWIKQGISAWMTTASIEEGRLPRSISKGARSARAWARRGAHLFLAENLRRAGRPEPTVL